MSFTGAYSELLAIRDGDVKNPQEINRHPRILDSDGFNTAHKTTCLSESAWQKNVVEGTEKDRSEYPTRTWRVLKGFKTWKPAGTFDLHRDPDLQTLIERIKNHEDYRQGPLGYGYNIERVGIPYGGWNGEWKHLFKEVSKYTEPFAFYHSASQHSFEDVTMFDEGTEKVYYVEVNDGEMYAETQRFERVNIKPEIEEIEKTANHKHMSETETETETGIGSKNE